MAYKWTTDLETGNPTIDRQHKELIDAINRLLDACAQGKGRTEIASTLQFLDNYIVRHFGDEEALQSRYSYPDIVNHKRYHETFKKTVKEIVGEFQAGGATIVLVGKVNSAIASWLINHIKKEDAKVAAHIKQRGR